MIQVTVDRYTRNLLTVIAVLLAIVAVGLYTQTPSTVQVAEAAIPDSGSQRQIIINQLKEMNGQLRKLNQALTKTTLKVEVTNADALRSSEH